MTRHIAVTCNLDIHLEVDERADEDVVSNAFADSIRFGVVDTLDALLRQSVLRQYIHDVNVTIGVQNVSDHTIEEALE